MANQRRASLDGLQVATSSASAAAVANVTAADADTQLRAGNTSRRGLLVFNDCDKALYLKYGTGASSSSFTVKVAAGGYWEMPAPIYEGAVNGRWEASPTGAARITELT